MFNGTAWEALSNNIARAEITDYLKKMNPHDRSQRSFDIMAELLSDPMELSDRLIEIISEANGSVFEFEALRIYAKKFGGNEQALAELQKRWGVTDRPPSTSKINPSFLYALAIGWPNSEILHPYLKPKELSMNFPIITVLALCGINGNEDSAIDCIDAMVRMVITDRYPAPAIYAQSLRDWAQMPITETTLKRLLDDDDPSRKITSIGLLAGIGKLKDKDRVVLVKHFDEIISEHNRNCPDGVDVMSGTIMTLPQTIYRMLNSELNNVVGS